MPTAFYNHPLKGGPKRKLCHPESRSKNEREGVKIHIDMRRSRLPSKRGRDRDDQIELLGQPQFLLASSGSVPTMRVLVNS
jgi:hypothetical protein